MIWDVPETICFLSKFYQLEARDLIITGAPAGVGPLQRGDKLVGHVSGLSTLSIDIF